MSNATDLQAALDLYKAQTGITIDPSAALAGALELYGQQSGAGLVLAAKDPAVVLAQALADYKAVTGVTLAPADPRRLHLQALLLLLAQVRALIDFSGKQSLLRFVSDLCIDALAELWALSRLPAKPSTTTERFQYASVASRTVPEGTRVTDGNSNQWKVTADTSATADHIDAPVECTVTGSATNGVAEGQITTLVDPDKVPGCTGVTNLSATISGREIEGLEDFRARLREAPESTSPAGPRIAYQENATKASASVADAVALGEDDSGDMAGTAPSAGEVFVVIIQGERDDDGKLISVVPDPDPGLLSTVAAALSAEDVRPLTDSVTVKAALFSDFDLVVTYYIAASRSESASTIQAAVASAFAEYVLWQESKIGRDINPSELISRLVMAGAKRVVVTSPSFAALDRDQSARCVYQFLGYGGVEDD